MKKMHQIYLRLLKERGVYNKIKRYCGNTYKAFKHETCYRNLSYHIFITNSLNQEVKKEWESLYTSMFVSKVNEKELIDFFKEHKKYKIFLNGCQKKYGQLESIKNHITRKLNDGSMPSYMNPIHEPYHLFNEVIPFGNTLTKFEKDWHVFVSDHLKELSEDI